MSKRALIVGGGVAGCACAYFLGKKGWQVDIAEASDSVGGMSKTKSFYGHKYEFGPHLWFWPHDDINDVVRELTHDRLRQVPRNLITCSRGESVRYPLHYEDIENMSDFDKIEEELEKYRDDHFDLIPNKMPKIGECTFEEYFTAAVGPTLYRKFMKDYTHKMWGIPGNVLTTRLVWADRIGSHYDDKPYDPIKFDSQGLGEGLKNWYPEDGWNVVWEGMVKSATIFFGTKFKRLAGNSLLFEYQGGKTWHVGTEEYDEIIWTIHTDLAFPTRKRLGANGRLVLPMIFPGRIQLPEGTESLHLSDESPVTRITDMSTITGIDNPGLLYLFELPGATTKPGFEFLSQWYEDRCYNHQSEEMIQLNAQYSARLLTSIPNIHFCGRNGEFKYYGMPQVVDSARRLCEEL